MFRDLGRNCRPGSKNRKKQRGKQTGKKGRGDPFGGMGIDIELGDGKGMEDMMMAMMLGEMMSEAQYGNEEDMEEAMAKEFLNMDKTERKEMLQDMTKAERKEFVQMIDKYETKLEKKEAKKKKTQTKEETKKKEESDNDGWETESEEEVDEGK